MNQKNLILTSALLFLAVFGFGQETIRGKVVDSETKEPLIGANILFVGTESGTITDYEGNFTADVPEGANAIEVSYIGYQPSIFVLDGRDFIDIELTSGEVLDEVVVIGYGTVQKRDVTGAINSLKPDDQQVLQYNSFQDFLQGRAAGVYIQSNGSEPLAPNTVRIRGSNSLRGDNEPLYVVDGIIMNSSTEDVADPLVGGNSYLSPQNGLTGINPQDIESIEILKDASATAIYGSRGANGVILITTKRGQEGKAKFNYRTTFRFGQPTNLIDFLDTEDFVDYQNEYRALQGFNPDFYTYGDGSIAQFVMDTAFMLANADSLPRLRPVNWYDDIFETSFSQTHRLSAVGGSDNSDYYIAAGYSDAQSFIPGSRARQGDFLLKLTQNLSDRFTLRPRLSASYTLNNASKGTDNLGSTNTSLIRQINLSAPLLGFEENNLEGETEDALDGPRAWQLDYDDDSREIRALASFTLDYKISDVFTYRLLTGIDYRNKKRQIWYGKGIFRGRLSNGEAGISELNRYRYNIDNTLRFRKRFNRNHRINGTVGVIFDGTNTEQSSFSASDFANEDLRYNGISFGQVFQQLSYERADFNILSFLGRINYTLMDRYLFTASFRSDGSSKFAEGNKYSFFPSAAFAWQIMKEPFMKNSNTFSELKLRVGYGSTGSQAIQPFQTFDRFGATANLLSDGQGNGVTAIVPQNLGNKDLIWETTDQFNAGIDFGFDNDRFSGSIDVYHKQTRDLLQQLNIGPSSGFSTIITNQGDLVNRGIEFGLTAHILEGPFKWTVSGNISMNRNEIKNLGLPPSQFGTNTFSAFLGRNVAGGTVFKVPANIFIEGQPAALFWGYQTNGIITTQEQLDAAPAVQGAASQLGDILYIDQNDDGNITDLDLTIIGDPNPDFFFGINSTFSYKGFTLDLFLNGVQGIDIANGNLGREAFALGNSNNIRSEAYFGAYREGATNATYPRLGYPIIGDFTDRFVEDGSFVRLTYITLSYTLPQNAIRGISGASIFVTGHNLLLFTDYSGFDPEVNSFAYDPSRIGVDWNSFPNQKAVSFGLNVNF